MDQTSYVFIALMFSSMDKGSWTFVQLPDDLDFEASEAFGRTPIIAEVNGKQWSTSLWREKSGQSYIAIPKKIRADKGNGDEIKVTFRFDLERIGKG